MLNKSLLLKIKELLLKERDELLKPVVVDLEIDADGDETDEIQANQLIEMNNQLSTRNVAKLAQIAEALHRINDGSYGLCQDCDEPIPDKRLLANPHFQTCVICAEKREAEEKQRKRF